MKRALLLASTLALFCQAAPAATLHFNMTPKLAGEKGFIMKPLDKNTTRFTIRVSTKNDPEAVDSRFPFVRGGSIDVRGEHRRVLRCSVQAKKQGPDLLYTFDLDNEHAKNSSFELVEHFEDGQVGGGKVFSYRLIDFIDPDYRAKEFLQDIRIQDLSKIELPSPHTGEPK